MEESNIKLIVDEEKYELSMIDYQLVVIDILNNALKNNGVCDRELRKNIIAEFEDIHGTLLDQGWISGEGGKVSPEVFFTSREFDEEEGLMDIDSIVIPEYASNFHDYSSGAFSYYFEDHDESLGDISYSSAAS